MKLNVVLACVAGLIIGGFVAFAYLHLGAIAVLAPKGPIAFQERGVMIITVLLSAIVVIPVFILLFYFAWKYSADNPKTVVDHSPNWDHDNWVAEFFWWTVPAVIIAFLAVLAWQTSHALDPFKPIASSVPPITIEAVALDWKWLFIYPAQGIATVNMVEFPENTPVRFLVTADAPMNQFWIPSLGGQIMAMPGMETQLNLLADGTGTYNGESSNISGAGFAGMTFTAHSVDANDFDAWVQSVQQASSSAPLDANAYRTLAKPSEYVPVSYYSSVDPDLYAGIMDSYMATSGPMVMTASSMQ